jgi:tRNA nucleotidyltransferase (CCA-adding enzyme)
MSKINQILKEVLNKINPPKEELNSISKFLKKFIFELEKKLYVMRIDADVFVGGSFAKKTMIKGRQYDIDIFIRFDEKYKKENISRLTLRALKEVEKNRKIILIHGSRDYFKINISPIFFIEIIPVIKIKNPKQAENITDLSYFHVNYIKKKLKTKKMLEEVRLAKAFCYANKCYGAESYISGFSGYAIELLIYHYKSFLNFIKAMTKIKEKEIIDIEKLYKNRYEIAMNMNSAKMNSPIILIDPTYKERNVLAALSNETFEEFKKACKKFLKNPKKEAFEIKEPDLESIKKKAIKKGFEFILLSAETDKQEGDVAGSKLLKFYKHLGKEIEKLYKINDKGFNYNGKKEAEYFFVIKSKGEIIQKGPDLKDFENVKIFKKHHKNTFEKQGRIYAKEKVYTNINQFIELWKEKNKRKIQEMGIKELRIVE